MDSKFSPMFDGEIIESIHKLTAETSKLKTEIFKTMTMNKDLDNTEVRYYLSFVNEFLKYWDDYSQFLSDKIKCSKGVEGIRTIDYQFVKQFIYANYDYAAVLNFTDGVMRGIDSKKFTKPSDIEDFFVYTVHKAFNDRGDSVAELLDSVLDDGLYIDNNKLVGKAEAALFDSVRNYNKLFDHRVRSTLYKAIDKTLEYITRELPGIKMSLDYPAIRLFVSVVNNVIEFITYSLTAFSTRIYIISKYSYPFINAYDYNEIKNNSPKFESVESSYDNGITVFRDVEDLMATDPNKLKEFCDIFNKFLISSGSDDFGSNKPWYSSHYIGSKSIETNPFCSKMIGNPLYLFITKDRFNEFNPYGANEIMINELHQNLKTYMYNNKQGLQGITTPKQEILHIIRGEEADDSLKGYQKLAKDLYIATLQICCNIESMINDLKRWVDEESIDHKHHISTLNRATESLHMVTELYRDIMSAILFKSRHIEMKINDFKKGDVKKILSDISINVPGEKKSDVSLNSNMMSVVPDTTRIPMELIDTYALPQFEYMQMFDEYLKLLPEFSSDLYLTEGVVSELINKLLSLIEAGRKRITVFFNNKATQSAVKWVKDHEQELMSMNFASDDKIENCFPLKDNITLPEGYKNLMDGLGKFNDSSIENDESLKKFIVSLYPNQTIYDWFESDGFKVNGKSAGPQMYRNLILFQDINNITKEAPKTATYQGDQLKDKFHGWIETVKNGNDIYKEYLTLDDAVSKGINYVKSKIVSMKDNPNNQNSNSQDNSNNANNNPSNDNDNNNGTAGPTDNQQDNATVQTGDGNTSTGSTVDNVVVEITKVINNIWIPLGTMICQAVKQEYKYMQMIYNAKKAESKK